MSALLSKLACCCTGEKAKQEPVAAEAVGMPEVAPSVVPDTATLNDEMIMARIRDIAFSLVKRSTVAIVQARIMGKTPNESFPPVLGKELSKISQHPDFDELVRVIMVGPTEENKAMVSTQQPSTLHLQAEKLSNALATYLINEAEKECPLILD